MSELKIKSVVALTKQDLESASGAFADILSLFPKDEKDYNHPRRKFDFVQISGKEEKAHEFKEVKVYDRKKSGFFDDNTTLFPVKITYTDGTSEYGFKYYFEKYCQKKPRLRPLYRKVGVINPKTGKIGADYDRSEMIPMWVEKVLPYYTGCYDNNSKVKLSKDDWAEVRNAVHSSHFTTRVKYSAPTIKKAGMKKIPWTTEESSGNGVWYATMTKYDEKAGGFTSYTVRKKIKKTSMINGTEVVEYENDGEELRIYTRMVEYSYMKSVYEEDDYTRRIYKVIPISNIFMISKENGDLLWDNMSSSLHGHL